DSSGGRSRSAGRTLPRQAGTSTTKRRPDLYPGLRPKPEVLPGKGPTPEVHPGKAPQPEVLPVDQPVSTRNTPD
ncbi:hypothetical protein RI367_008858, partial [Sorochytrium milnesiophthora]